MEDSNYEIVPETGKITQNVQDFHTEEEEVSSSENCSSSDEPEKTAGFTFEEAQNHVAGARGEQSTPINYQLLLIFTQKNTTFSWLDSHLFQGYIENLSALAG